MAKTLRVHQLAKELGVASKEIVSKCQAEGLDAIKNHMSTVSIGLAESVREWFSQGEDVTSVEEAAAVDLEKVVRQPHNASLAEGGEDEQGSSVATEVAVADADEAPVVADTAEDVVATADTVVADTAVAEAEESSASAELVAESPESQVVEEPVTASEPVAEVSETTEPEAAVETSPADAAGPAETVTEEDQAEDAVAEPEAPEEPVAPAGPQVVPKPAELKGPRVVRIEAPEQVRAPRPRPSGSGGGSGGGGGAGDIAARQAEGEGGAGRGKRGRRGGGGEADSDSKHKGRSPRRGGSTDVGERIREWRDQDLIERRERLASATGQGFRTRRAAERRRQTTGSSQPSTIARKGEVEIETPIVLKDYCAAIGVPFAQVMKKIMDHSGTMMLINQSIDSEMAELVAVDFGITVKLAEKKTASEALKEEFDSRERKKLASRPPIVAMLGHVDHGKTSLLDRLRNTDVAAGEAGGITQHIGASRIETPDGPVTFLDTPGHEAFTAMRARGAHLTDVVVLVIAADDGVMPQTIEAINHAKAAEVQIVVALNKIDLPGADINKVYGQLAEHELTPTEWGGSTDVVKTSAQTGEGIEELLTHLSTLSELMELQADATVPAQGTVIESSMVEGQGAVARILVQEGTLKVGQIVVCGPGYGKVRSLLDSRSKRIKEAGPGTPVGVVGLDQLPDAGDKLYMVGDMQRAKNVAEEARLVQRAASLSSTQKAKGLEDLLAGANSADIPILNLIVKADAAGSIETLKAQLEDFPAEKAKLRILHAAVGAVTEADVALAQASSAIIIGFHVVADDRARSAADEVGVEIRNYRVIYEILDDVHKALEGLLEPVKQEEHRGTVEVRQVFNVSSLGTIAGCFVTDGVVTRNNRVRLVRDGVVVLENAGIQSLRRFKDDVREVKNGFECGIKLEKFDDIKPGDKLDIYEIVEVSAKL